MTWYARIGLVVLVLLGLHLPLAASPAGSKPVDTVFNDPWDARLYSGGHVKRDLAVPLVEMDTSTYEKKFWLSEKRLVSVPQMDARNPSLAAGDSSVVAAYRVPDSADQGVFSTPSLLRGVDWGEPNLVHWSSYFPQATSEEGSFYLSYGSDEVSDDWYRRILWRRAEGSPVSWRDSVVILSSIGSSKAVFRPQICICDDTIFVTSQYYEDGDRYFIVMRTLDDGNSWSLVGDTIGPGVGSPHAFIVADSVWVIVHQPSYNVAAQTSTDGGITWSDDVRLSSDDYYGQAPATSCAGDSIVHAVWYDFESGSSGWGGVPYYRRSVDCGVTWEPTQALTESYYCEELDIWADSQRVYAVWNDARAGSPDYAMYMRVSHDNGSTWLPEQMIVDQVDPAWDPDVYGNGDYVWFAWREQHPPDWIWGVYVKYGAWYVPGDVDMSGEIDIQDLVFLVTYMFNGGPQPWVLGACEMDGNGVGPDIADLVYLVTYMFGGGPPPVG